MERGLEAAVELTQPLNSLSAQYSTQGRITQRHAAHPPCAPPPRSQTRLGEVLCCVVVHSRDQTSAREHNSRTFINIRALLQL